MINSLKNRVARTYKKRYPALTRITFNHLMYCSSSQTNAFLPSLVFWKKVNAESGFYYHYKYLVNIRIVEIQTIQLLSRGGCIQLFRPRLHQFTAHCLVFPLSPLLLQRCSEVYLINNSIHDYFNYQKE